MIATEQPVVFIVDDDEIVCMLIASLVQSLGYRAETFPSALDFLEQHEPVRPACLVTDVRMPEMTGLELLGRLTQEDSSMPIILVTAHADVPMAVEAMKSSSVLEFIEKPFDHERLLNQIRAAMAFDTQQLAETEYKTKVTDRLAKLTAREEQILNLVVAGRANKQIAFHLDISEKTVEAHRSRLMRKLEARSVADLVRMSLVANTDQLLTSPDAVTC